MVVCLKKHNHPSLQSAQLFNTIFLIGDGKVQRDMATDSTSAWLGTLIRSRRKQLGLTQKDIATRLGLTPQQVQKYESGVDALRVTRLLEFSQALNYSFERALLSFARVQAQNLSVPNGEDSRAFVVQEDVAPFQTRGKDLASKQPNESDELVRKSRKRQDKTDGSLTVTELETFFEQFLLLEVASQRSIALLVSRLSEESRD